MQGLRARLFGQWLKLRAQNGVSSRMSRSFAQGFEAEKRRRGGEGISGERAGSEMRR